MAVRKICKPKGCRGSPRCSHPWWFDVMCRGKRWRMRVDDFAIARGAKEPIASKQTAERVWEPKFVAEIMAGRDPRIAPVVQPAAERLAGNRPVGGADTSARATSSRDGLSVVCQSAGEKVARPAGLEPATSWFVARRSIQLG